MSADADNAGVTAGGRIDPEPPRPDSRSPDARGPDTRPDDRASVAYLDPALWTVLNGSRDAAEFASAWLALLCQSTPRVHGGVVVLAEGGDRRFEPVAAWPRGWAPGAPVMAAAEAALAERAAVARAARIEGSADRAQVAHPFIVDDAIVGVVALDIDIRPRKELSVLLRDIQWGAAWIEALIRRRSGASALAERDRLQIALDLFAAMLDTRGVDDASSAFATRLATALGCDRVSLGVRSRQAFRILAVSHSAHVDGRMALVGEMTRLMEEAADQRRLVNYPEAEGTATTVREHAAFARRREAGAILTAPFAVDDARIGALVLERSADRPFTAEEAALVAALGALAGPVLEDRLAIARPVARVVADAAKTELGRLLGPAGAARKAGVAAALFMAAFALFATGTFRVTADTTVEGAVRRAIVAPFDGYVDGADVRPGDEVAEGDMLARLDTSDLQVQRVHWMSERRKASLEYAKAMAERDRAALGVLSAQIEQAEAQIDLLTLQIERAALRSPFAGLVVDGDLTQRVGAAVGRGDVLFEIAPLDAYRVVLKVADDDIAHVAVGQRGRLVLSSMPGAAAPFEITAVTPVATPEGGKTYFRVEARIDSAYDVSRLRPGMEGVAKIDAGRRRLVWIWTREIGAWLRLALWRWLP